MVFEVEVLDLGLNNVASLVNSLKKSGADEVRVVNNPAEYSGSNLLVLPGVGAFGASMEVLNTTGLIQVVQKHVESGDFLMGICLGMQLLTDKSEESPGVPGIGLIPGTVEKLVPTNDTRVPHIGWSPLEASSLGIDAFPSLKENLDYYFVHSYAVQLSNSEYLVAETEFGQNSVTASFMKDNVIGFQFHPEKSSNSGLKLLRDVVGYVNG